MDVLTPSIGRSQADPTEPEQTFALTGLPPSEHEYQADADVSEDGRRRRAKADQSGPKNKKDPRNQSQQQAPPKT